MSLQIALSDSLRDFVEAQVARGGYGSPSEYVEALVQRAQQHVEDPELEALVLAGLNSGPPIEATEDYWRARKDRLIAEQRRADAP